MFSIESRKISLIKGVTWRLVGTLDTVFISWFFTGDITKAFKIGGIELITKIVLYYLHERAWNLTKKGKKEIITDSGKKIAEDKHSRSVLKGISWRVIGTFDTMVIAFFVTGNYSRALEIGITEVFTKMFLFYLHERIWLKITRVK
jgi:uncharacterized membrane protein